MMTRTLLAAGAALLCSTVAQASQDAYARAQVMVDVGGRKLNMYCMGSGSPTVIFEAGGGRAGWDWAAVQPEVAKRTRACVYDRAGMGFSEPLTRPATSGNAAKDLNFLLKNARLQPPYVLVGNSYGGMVAQQYAYRNRANVAGLVLLDAQHEDAQRRLDALTGGRMSQMDAANADMVRNCLAGAEKGFEAGSELEKTCALGGRENAEPKVASAQAAMQRKPSYWRAHASEIENVYSASSDQLRAARKPFGDLPLVSLTRGVSPYLIPGQPQSDTNKAVEAENKAMQDEVTALSTRGVNRVVPDAPHAIHLGKPEAVVAAVMEVLDMLK
ncbi:alpha/beta fold hydrolase [Pseudoduganella namucuonensis]|uniref:Pimeloyl-ACP methyl ester carboxylesterase n=1 Tax=Pseudoduganella namucuonensis TaxID=1035707 RepID=A0A1I7LWP4_9BURK|nr:alpha/beta hydrolase [Pseudoduganella namucuonensis]SFV14079.1 Pimeloyl-ACP methyl ester carboxylesterase [Pseudoduganella namucuonensis]